MATLRSILTQFQKLPNQEALIALIDLKTEDDMEKVLNRLDAMDAKFEAKFDAIESKFDAKLDAMESRFDAMNTKLSALDSKISNTRWFILGTIAVVGLLLKLLPSISS